VRITYFSLLAAAALVVLCSAAPYCGAADNKRGTPKPAATGSGATPAFASVEDKTASPVPPRRQIGFGRRAMIVTNPALFRTPRRHDMPIAAEKSVKRSTLYAVLVGALIVSAGAVGLSAAVDSPRSLMDRNEYLQSKKAIEADSRLNLSKCRDVEGAARELCRAEGRADERTRKAELEASYRGTVAAAEDARLERAKARYDVARAKCTDQRGEDSHA